MVLAVRFEELSSSHTSQRGFGCIRNVWHSHQRTFEAPALDVWRTDPTSHSVVAIVEQGRQGYNPGDGKVHDSVISPP